MIDVARIDLDEILLWNEYRERCFIVSKLKEIERGKRRRGSSKTEMRTKLVQERERWREKRITTKRNERNLRITVIAKFLWLVQHSIATE